MDQDPPGPRSAWAKRVFNQQSNITALFRKGKAPSKSLSNIQLTLSSNKNFLSPSFHLPKMLCFQKVLSKKRLSSIKPRYPQILLSSGMSRTMSRVQMESLSTFLAFKKHIMVSGCRVPNNGKKRNDSIRNIIKIIKQALLSQPLVWTKPI